MAVFEMFSHKQARARNVGNIVGHKSLILITTIHKILSIIILKKINDIYIVIPLYNEMELLKV